MEAFAEALRKAVRRPEAVDVAMQLYEQYESVYGSVPADIQQILKCIAAIEDDMLDAREYVKKKGVMEEFVQGRQRIRRENKCVKLHSSLAQAQARLIGSLKLSAGTVPEEQGDTGGVDDEFDNF